MGNARAAAFAVLNKIERSAAYSNLALDAQLRTQPLEAADASLTSAIVYTVLERRVTIDYNLSLCLKQSIAKLRPEVLTALRIGCCQILFMDKIPVSAAVNESVKLVKEHKCEYASGLVNAVLRNVSKNGLCLPDEDAPDYLTVKYSCPAWLIELWTQAYGEQNMRGILEASIGSIPDSLRVNTLKTTPDKLVEQLRAQGLEAYKSSLTKDAVVLERAGSVETLDEHAQGLFHVQDTASQLCCKALGAEPGDTVFDMCSAPGGKAFTVAQQMENRGVLKAFDIYPQRLELIKRGAQRLGIDCLETAVNDAAVYNEQLGKADKILCDVPCSGLGVICKKPEIRYKTPQDIDKLPDLQYGILCTACKYLKKGGILVYSTCTLNPAENENVCRKFLSEHPSFKSIGVKIDIAHFDSGDGFVTLLPGMNDTDGFFVAAFCETE